MIPILYSKTETTFTSNGLGRLAECTRCVVTEERNGSYECEFSYPISGKHYADIEEGCFIGCTHDDDGDMEPFEIYRRSAPINGIVTFNARHLSYRLSFVILNTFTANNISDTLTGLGTNAINTNPFTFWTDKATFAPFAVDRPSSVRSVMGGVEGSILDIYGGEWEFTKWTVKLWANRGTNSGVTIRYGKNMRDLQQVVDAGDAYNSVVPYWAKEEEDQTVLVTLPEKIVSAAGVTTIVPVVLDMSADFLEQPTEAQLRTAALDYLDKHSPWIPNENIKVDFVQLWQTTEYAGVANLQKVRLCDTVNVYYPALGVTLNDIKVIKVVYNVLADRYDSMELGQPSATFADAITADLNKQITKSQQVMEGFFDAAISTATELLSGNQGGHVVIKYDVNGKPQQILVMDTEDELTATNILRISLNGIGFSTNGGVSYDTAWTLNGQFVADFITAGTLRAIMIQGPTADTFWNLSSGVFQSQGVRQVEGYTGPTTNPTIVTYNVNTKTRLEDGTLKVIGRKESGTEDTVFTDEGVQANKYDYTFYPDGGAMLYDVDAPSRTYPHGGLLVRGAKANFKCGNGRADIGDNVYTHDGHGNPLGTITPDFAEFGRPEDYARDDGQSIGNNRPERNIARISGGWVDVDNALIFQKNYDIYWNNGVLMRNFYNTPIIHRGVWDAAPKSSVKITGPIFLNGIMTGGKNYVYVSIPLSRPISKDVISAVPELTVNYARCHAQSTGFITSAQRCEFGGAVLNPSNVVFDREFGISFRINKSSGTWTSNATAYGYVFMTVSDIEIKLYDYDIWE